MLGLHPAAMVDCGVHSFNGSLLGTVLPAVDADIPRQGLPVDDNLFDLIPASKLELRNLRPRGAAPHRAAG